MGRCVGIYDKRLHSQLPYSIDVFDPIWGLSCNQFWMGRSVCFASQVRVYVVMWWLSPDLTSVHTRGNQHRPTLVLVILEKHRGFVTDKFCS
jgi:hypothetical protein